MLEFGNVDVDVIVVFKKSVAYEGRCDVLRWAIILGDVFVGVLFVAVLVLYLIKLRRKKRILFRDNAYYDILSEPEKRSGTIGKIRIPGSSGNINIHDRNLARSAPHNYSLEDSPDYLSNTLN
eukprot:TRINITY_DN4629_c0_g1_i2.p2 TRINITY_DN4629_c0_g1~~TRINITY_DN4629_c0_g1_i2.p2  ORF type:complete len:123 (+),score=23.32 TRINITY_DN4629_c0_g1_i2:370-738(+)